MKRKFSAITSALVLATAALAFPPRDALEVSVSTAEYTATADILRVVASITNNGTDDITVLRYGSVLDNLPTQAFTVTKDGVVVPFTGVKVTLSLENLSPSAYITLRAGETASVEHDVSKLYDFGSVGEGTFQFEPLPNIHVLDKITHGRPTLTPYALVGAAKVSVQLSGDLYRHKAFARKTKRATVVCNNPSQASFISAAYSEAKLLASLAASYTNSICGIGSALFSAYWKTNSCPTVASRFAAIASENLASRTISCSDPLGLCTNGLISYTTLSGSRPIYLCPLFYNEPATSTLCSLPRNYDVRGTLLLHELTHSVLDGINDLAFGCSAVRALNATSQLRNAENYVCYAADVYAQGSC